MRIMVIGGGGREHAIIKKIKDNPIAEKIYALPGNGGISNDAECIDISATDLEGILSFAKSNAIDYAIVAPDDPLVMGLVDLLEEEGIPCFGPSKAAAIIEGSKAFSKELMKKYGIPTAEYEIFNDIDSAYEYIEHCNIPVVVKADGLALGKGVIICDTREAAKDAIKSIMEDKAFGKSGDTIVIEEYLEGPEVSVLAFTDGNALFPMVASTDHKRALDGDKGLNTGGMGTIAPSPYYTEEIAEICKEEIFLPTMIAMNREGRRFKGCLYFGLMITKDGPKVIEYNCRFGDPETQVVLPLLESDLLDIMMAITEERLDEIEVSFSKSAACCVIMASKGYPLNYEKGFPISFDKEENYKEKNIFIAGAKLSDDGVLLTNGGRVLGVTEIADTLGDAIAKAYNTVSKIHFDNSYYRKDIGKKALEEINGI